MYPTYGHFGVCHLATSCLTRAAEFCLLYWIISKAVRPLLVLSGTSRDSEHVVFCLQKFTMHVQDGSPQSNYIRERKVSRFIKNLNQTDCQYIIYVYINKYICIYTTYTYT